MPLQQHRLHTNRHKETGTSPLQSIEIEQQQAYHSSSNNSSNYHTNQSNHHNIASNIPHSTSKNNIKSETNQENLPGLVVTRSTSPIQTDIIKSILKEDNIIHNINDNDYTIHIKSYQPLNNQVKDLPLSEHDGIYDPIYDNPPKNEEYYSTLLRDRLRHILLDYNNNNCNNKERISENIEVEVERTDYEDMNSSLEEYNNKKKRNNYANNYNERKYLRRITNNQSKSQYNQCNHHNNTTTSTSTTTANNTTEELMKSMAQIMTAVGNIVSKPKPMKYKSVLKKYQLQHQQQYYENNEGCSSNSSSSNIQYTQHNSDSSNSNMLYNHNNRNYKDYNNQNYNIHCNQHNIHHNSSKQFKQPIAQMTSPSIAQMTSPSIAQMTSPSIAQMMLQPAGVPRNKAAMIDMILMKIQVITVTIAFYV